jgi:hypothetical protein
LLIGVLRFSFLLIHAFMLGKQFVDPTFRESNELALAAVRKDLE